jgi:ABC-type glycerol-3-phosphate transport system substrate-binding protein
MKRLIVLTSALLCIGVLLAACAASSKTAAKDVSITSCQASPTGGHPKAAGEIVNHSSKASIYTVHVKFKDSSGNGVGDGVAAVAKVEPGKKAKWDATGTVNAKGPVNCQIGSVTRGAVP